MGQIPGEINQNTDTISSTAHGPSGLLSFHGNTSLDPNPVRTKGFDAGIVLVFNEVQDIQTFRDHPLHQGYTFLYSVLRLEANKDLRVMKFREEYTSDTLVTAIEF